VVLRIGGVKLGDALFELPARRGASAGSTFTASA
jgi:hypothetical protein